MLYEFLYKNMFRAVKAVKKHYFSRMLEGFNKDLLKTLDDGSWSSEDRDRQYAEKVWPYWRKFGYRPEKFWFALNCSRDHQIDPRFIPSDLYYNELLPYINNLPFRYALQDKCLLDLRFSGVRQAAAVCRRMAGVFYGPDMEQIDSGEAVRLCKEHESYLFIKPSMYTSAGVGISQFLPRDCTEDDIMELFADTGKNFIVQERIRQHPALAKLNPDSVSTVRVTSLFVDGEVYISNIMIRVGPPGASHVAAEGGYSVAVEDDGHIYPLAYRDKGSWVCGAEEGLYDDSSIVPGLEKIRDAVKRLHPLIPYFKWIGWDFSVDEEGEPVMIEFNNSPGDDIQRVCGNPLFGEMTDRVLEDYFHTRAMENDQFAGMWCGTEQIRRY